MRTFALDQETDQIVESIQVSKRSAFIRSAIRAHAETLNEVTTEN